MTGAIVRTDRLELRPPRAEDLDDYHAAIGADPEVRRWLPGGQPVTKAALAERFPHVHLADHAERGFGVWVATLRDEGTILGQCGIRFVEETGEVEVLYALGSAHWGRGYATEGAAASLRFGFEEIGLERIVAFAKPDNVRSIRVMEKLGMAFDRSDHVFGLDVVVRAIERSAFRPGPGAYEVVR